MKKVYLSIITICWFFQCQRVQAQTATVSNVPAKNTARVPIPAGASVFGVFDGRSPCEEIAKEINVKAIPECIKIKWRLILFQDSLTHAPTTYTLEGFVYRNPPKTGKWAITRGTKTDANAIVFALDPDNIFMFLLKADNNVLFFMDKERKLMVGNENFSYALYRTVN